MFKKIALTALVVILCLVNYKIFGKEKHLKEGAVVYLELAPVDPRSLMQGDYMALRFQLATDVYKALPKEKNSRRWRRDIAASDGYVVAELNDQRIGTFKRVHTGEPLSENEILLRYRIRDKTVKFATNAWFFQEGDAACYETARYGQLRVDNQGDLLLVAMYDKDLNELIPAQE
jgi:uncharacterized membrane-anchored protein